MPLKEHYQFIDLIKQEDRVVHTDSLEAVDDSARHGADVGPSVASDVRLVTATTK